MTQTMDLNKMGLAPMSELEMQETDGGLWWFPAALGIGLVLSAINNFGDIREGLADGWNGKARH